ncbi:TetR/AcrR family transcriptional regulator [Mesorhizobium sp. WSM3868]|uniref:TetR/AcrR family transcriptional regulator n=1 Tax=Mesorhizobium sp. WSM3868 TaxID=2029405 RepID=UPI000BAFF609|nr:TetR/AcrR family transcriptional regulator [Mesorhizobium sp. WSM3868]PBB35425.1 TetR family transcriptional regulator [Mesorhizobium sp. WSM3868]
MAKWEVIQRKIPRQERAKATLEAIVQAAAQLLTDVGFEALTTARVAERAGVSVGSLYQYFPNKQALAAAVVDHYAEKLSVAFVQAVAERAHGSLEETVGAMIEVAMAAHPHDPKLHRALNELAPRYRAEKVREVGDRIATIIKSQLARHRREIAPDLDLGDAAALIETLLENVVHRAIERHPVSVAGERAMGQCRRMIMAYLTSVDRHAA